MVLHFSSDVQAVCLPDRGKPMGRIVYAQLDIALGSDATQDIWNLLATSAVQVRMHGWELTSAALTAALMDINFHRVSSVGTGGTTVTEALADEAGSPKLADLVTDAEGPGAPIAAGDFMSYQWEQLGPVGHVWTPEMRPISKVSEGFAVTCNTAIAATLSGWVCWEEL